MHILVTNDDGVFAPGIIALQKALRQIKGAKVSIIAPAQNQSAIGHRKTLRDPLRINPVTLEDGTPAHACSGSPADAVALALMGYIKEPVDIVISGINQGPNLGQDITYSGTVTAAMEAVIYRLPAIAVSINSYTETLFEGAAAFTARLASLVLEKGLPELTLLNVNVPVETPTGARAPPQRRRYYPDKLLTPSHPRGQPS